MKPLAVERLAQIEKELSEATDGPWEYWCGDTSGGYEGVFADRPRVGNVPGPHIIGCQFNYNLNMRADKRFIAHSPTFVAELVAEVKRLQAALLDREAW